MVPMNAGIMESVSDGPLDPWKSLEGCFAQDRKGVDAKGLVGCAVLDGTFENDGAIYDGYRPDDCVLRIGGCRPGLSFTHSAC
jgi:hypothetical protein